MDIYENNIHYSEFKHKRQSSDSLSKLKAISSRLFMNPEHTIYFSVHQNYEVPSEAARGR